MTNSPPSGERTIVLLRAYAAVTTAALAVIALTAFRQSARPRFDEIDVERINVIEKSGRVRLVISNQERAPDIYLNGKTYHRSGGNGAGLIFYNDEGTENGGLTFTGQRRPDGTYTSSTGMSFDQFNQDETLTLRYSDDNGRKTTGITIAERDERDIYDLIMARDSINKMTDSVAKTAALQRLFAPRNGVPLRATRVYLGRDAGKSAVLSLSDPSGRPRLRLKVDSLGVASLEFLDEKGAVTSRLPGS